MRSMKQSCLALVRHHDPVIRRTIPSVLISSRLHNSNSASIYSKVRSSMSRKIVSSNLQETMFRCTSQFRGMSSPPEHCRRHSRFHNHSRDPLSSVSTHGMLMPHHLSYSTSTSRAATSAPNSNSLTPFLLADIGEGIAEVEVLQWYVKPGDVIQQFDLICQVQSDKATVDITSRYDGIVDSLHANGVTGELVRVGQPLLHLQTPPAAGCINDAPASESTITEASTLASATDESDSSDDDDDAQEGAVSLKASETRNNVAMVDPLSIQASPAVRKLSRDHGILDLSTLYPGSGPGGRIVKGDILTHVASRSAPSTCRSTAVAAATSTDTLSNPSRHTDKDVVIPLRGYRRHMFKAMTAALETPHMCLSDELVLNELMKARQTLNAASNPSNPKISVLALICKAISCSLEDYPTLNAQSTTITSSGSTCSTSADEPSEVAILQRSDHNIGIAMDTTKGLIVPVIRQCQRKSIRDIQGEIDRFKEIASSSTLSFGTDDLANATMTISNIGSMGAGMSVHPVLAPPALAMIALGRIQTVPRFESVPSSDAALPQVYAASILTITYAVDHRYVDGATVARFHVRLAQKIQNPIIMLSKLA